MALVKQDRPPPISDVTPPELGVFRVTFPAPTLGTLGAEKILSRLSTAPIGWESEDDHVHRH